MYISQLEYIKNSKECISAGGNALANTTTYTYKDLVDLCIDVLERAENTINQLTNDNKKLYDKYSTKEGLYGEVIFKDGYTYPINYPNLPRGLLRKGERPISYTTHYSLSSIINWYGSLDTLCSNNYSLNTTIKD